MWPYFPKWVTLILFVIFSDICITVESAAFSLKWCKNDQNRFSGLVIITVWSHNHHSISFWEIGSVFSTQTLATNRRLLQTPFGNISKHVLCISSTMSDAEKMGNLILLKTQNKKIKIPLKRNHSEKVTWFPSESFEKAGSRIWTDMVFNPFTENHFKRQGHESEQTWCLTPSQPRCHLKTTTKSEKSESLKAFSFLFCTRMWKDFHHKT